MTDSADALDAVGRAASELVPELTTRLERHGLGEIEVAHGELRLRVRAAPSVPAQRTPGEPDQRSSSDRGGADAEADAVPPSSFGVTSPAVGFFVYADGLGPGLGVSKGDPLGQVEMLGVRHDVRVPRAGTVRRLIAESGEAVEYGQVVVEVEAAVEALR